MEQFKLKSIDELDLEFVSATRGQFAQETKEPKSLIPEISKSEPAPVPDEPVAMEYFNNPETVYVQENPIYSPTPEQPEKKKARPLVPIGQRPSPYAPVGAYEEPQNEEVLDFSDANYGEAKIEPEKKKAKASGGVLAGKIISIIMLCVTVLTFVFGCFISIFLDNGGSDIGGLCFNTLSQDIEALEISEGSLVISKKLNVNEYENNNYVAVPASGISGCDIQKITSITVYSEDNASFMVSPISTAGYPYTIPLSSCYGVVKYYIPALGEIINFAMDNAILVCVLFILLSAFWCLMLVLMGRSSKYYAKNETPQTKIPKEKKPKVKKQK